MKKKNEKNLSDSLSKMILTKENMDIQSQQKENSYAYKESLLDTNGNSDEKIDTYVSQYRTDLVRDAGDYVLLKSLAPQIRSNEKCKRNLKPKLLQISKNLLKMEFLFLIFLITITFTAIITAHFLHNPFSDTTIQSIFAFIGAYITSIVVELIFILKHIVTNVFDSSISDLMKAFRVSAIPAESVSSNCMEVSSDNLSAGDDPSPDVA